MKSTIPFTTFDIQGPDGILRADSWGPADAPVVVLVHGYPDNRTEWRGVAEHLAGSYRVVAYDVRGAGDSFKPTGRAAYKLERLMADFKAVIDTVSPNQPVHLVAHDWGSVQSWEFATEPALKHRIASYVSCSGPCLDHLGFWVRSRFQKPTPKHLYQATVQLLKSWYVYLFHVPFLAELQWKTFLGKMWPTVMRHLEGVHIEPRSSQASDGALGVWLYRSNVFPRLLAPRERHAQVPVMVLVPLKDNYVSPWPSQDLPRWVPQLERQEINEGHWVLISDPEGFAKHVRGFIERVNARQPAAA